MKDKKTTELLSSAFTMSDMELFIFPELVYAGVLANIISPRIWKWRDDPWFKDIEKRSPLQQIQRLKQYIMDHYTFNLDLETWGLTTKEKELERFDSFVKTEDLARSNALFGYEGDKYYFSVDIRKHFGLDKYRTNIIPYWKTETVEAMDAFRYKEYHEVGAGECVSLANIYIASLFIILRIPLEKIFIIGTPLHSQNYIDMSDGVITNNRRIVTKNMWFNGSAISDQARRALENESASYISHISGYIHRLYPEATINQEAYGNFEKKIETFLHTPINTEIFANFLRSRQKYQQYFQFSYDTDGKTYYIKAETLYRYELSSKNRVSDNTRKNLLAEVDFDDFELEPYEGSHIYNKLEANFNKHHFCCRNPESVTYWKSELFNIPNLDEFISDLRDFSCVSAKIPEAKNKTFIQNDPLVIDPNSSMEEITKYLSSKRNASLTANLAFLAGRFVREEDFPYFLKASIQRNPVTIEYFAKETRLERVFEQLLGFDNSSIYGKGQLATPDEVVNFRHGNGLEKAITLATVIMSRDNEADILIHQVEANLILEYQKYSFSFASNNFQVLKLSVNKELLSF